MLHDQSAVSSALPTLSRRSASIGPLRRHSVLSTPPTIWESSIQDFSSSHDHSARVDYGQTPQELLELSLTLFSKGIGGHRIFVKYYFPGRAQRFLSYVDFSLVLWITF